MPLRAKPFAPHCAIPTPWPQPWPVTTKTGSPARGGVAAWRGFRASDAAEAKPATRKPQMTPAVRASARDIGVGDLIAPDLGQSEASGWSAGKAVSLQGFHGKR